MSAKKTVIKYPYFSPDECGMRAPKTANKPITVRGNIIVPKACFGFLARKNSTLTIAERFDSALFKAYTIEVIFPLTYI